MGHGSASASATLLLERTGSTAPTDPLADALLFNAARRQLVREVIAPQLVAGTTVICARFADSTLAYQGYGAGVELDRAAVLADAATDGLHPDLTFVLDLPVEDGFARKAPGDVTRFEAEYDLAFHAGSGPGSWRSPPPSLSASSSSTRRSASTP